MAQNDFDSGDLGDAELALEPQRTSILAILALICALICIIPGMGLLAAILGISAAIGISGSRGRVGGMGLAIAGIVLGLLFSMIWVGIVLGSRQALGFAQSNLFAPGGQVITAMDNGDMKGARALFTPTADKAITDEQIEAFRTAFQAELGAFQGVPQGFVELWIGYRDLSPQAYKKLQGSQNAFPIPGKFAKGTALIVFQMDPSAGRHTGGNSSPASFPVTNIWITTAAGKVIELLPTPGSGAATPAPAGGTTPTPAPATPPPAPDAPKEPGSGG